MSWHYIEHGLQRSGTYKLWWHWLKENVGEQDIKWKLDDHAGHLFIGFADKEDATAFTLRFRI